MGQSSVAEPLPDLYRTLQVDPVAHPGVIKAAYRVLIRMAHPDVGGDVRVAQSLNSAYSILSDPESRTRYDQVRTQNAPRRPRPPAMDVGAALKSRLGRMLEPLGGPPLAAGFDLVARLGSDGDHRIWFKALRDSDPTRTAAFRRLAEVGRLTRPLWQWGSDLFVALVPRWRPELADLVQGPLGPWPRLGSAIVVLDAQTGLIRHRGRTNEVPAYPIVAKAFREVMLACRKRAA